VLAVDGDSAVRQKLSQALTSAGSLVSSAASARQVVTLGARLQPDVVSFTRMLRVVMRYDGRTPAEDLLVIRDRRTLVRFLRLGDPTPPVCVLPMSVQTFLDRQAWIANPVALAELRRALTASTPPRVVGIASCSESGGRLG
jgi:CheY-like chemotaxis protein